MMRIKTSDLVIADLRFYEKHNGAEVDFDMPKVILKYNEYTDKYHNIFSLDETYPLYERANYSNVTMSGESYGTKLVPKKVSEILDYGICAIESDDKLINEIRKNDYIDIKELEDIVIESPLYFKDRIDIIGDRFNDDKLRIYLKHKTFDLDKYTDSQYENKDFFSYYHALNSIGFVGIVNGVNIATRSIKESINRKKYKKLFNIALHDIEKNSCYHEKLEYMKVKQKIKVK